METFYGSREDTQHTVSQGFILGQLVFNIFICDTFLMPEQANFSSYADDITPYTIKENAEEVIRTLEEVGKPLLKWFQDNKMKLNPYYKCFLLLSGKEDRAKFWKHSNQKLA